MYFVYIIQSQKNKCFYIGSTQDLDRRLKEHESGKTRSLKNKGPFEIVRIEKFFEKSEAIKREHQIKKYKGGRAFKNLINKAFGDVA
jgi:putative endonuclease